MRGPTQLLLRRLRSPRTILLCGKPLNNLSEGKGLVVKIEVFDDVVFTLVDVAILIVVVVFFLFFFSLNPFLCYISFKLIITFFTFFSCTTLVIKLRINYKRIYTNSPRICSELKNKMNRKCHIK